jgi:4-amino-4-deoxy-L-arabinose transferase-like glycosyltransferase
MIRVWQQALRGARRRLGDIAWQMAKTPGRWLADIDVRIAIGVGLATVVLLAATATQGFVRDEGYYFRAASEYHTWFTGLWQNLWAGRLLESFSDATLSRAFGYNAEHPGLMKILMGWTWKIFHHWLGWTSHATGYRLASMIMVGVGTAYLYLLGRRLSSPTVGLLAVALFLACPHVFFHTHLACFDGPIVAMTVVTTYAFWRSLTSRAWILGAGVAWGLAVATKHNAVFLVPTLALAWLLSRLPDFRLTRDQRLTLPPIPLAFFAMAALGPLIFYIFYPYGWHDPIGRIGSYYHYHAHHEHYPVDYFGTLYTQPPFPWSFPFVMSAMTIPAMVLVPGIAGLGVWLVDGVQALASAFRREDRCGRPAIDTWLIVVSILVPPLIIALPTVPIFGGTKHWMPMMPFFCLLSAWTMVRAIEQLEDRVFGRRMVVRAVVLVLLLAGPIYETARTHPLGHTYFNELVGGHQGGAALGMPRTFWGGDARQLLPLLNSTAAPGATVFTDRMNYDGFRAYQKDGLLRSDLRWLSDLRRADWAFVNHQREYQDNEYRIWALIGERRPVAVIEHDGVPIVSLYRVRAQPPKKK